MRLSTRIPTTAQLRAHERAWIDTCHANWGMVLMEIAGRRAAEVTMTHIEHNPGPVAIFCGSGNNGGDGLVVARYLYMCGIPVVVHLVEGTKKGTDQKSESAVNRTIIDKLGLTINVVGSDSASSIRETLSECGMIVDALLGTGLDRPVADVYQSIINGINGSGKFVVAIDVPSGVNSDTGQVMGIAVHADTTVTFGYLKAGLLNFPGAELAGEIHVVDIGLPSMDHNHAKELPRWWLSTGDRVRALLPDRPPDAHKGDFGRLLTIAGSVGMSGAAMMAAKTGLRTGAGLSILATAKSLTPHLPPQEIIYKPLAETASGTIAPKAVLDLELEIENASAIVLGPGLSLNVDSVQFVHDVLKSINKPCLIDADGLNALAQSTGALPRSGNFVLTPHPKELSRLLGIETAQVQHDRIAIAQSAAEKFACTVVLKGARTIIASPEKEVFINPTGNAGMATAGSGDVLSGIIGGLLAQGLDPFEAAIAGTYVHGVSGDLAAHEIGDAGIVAGDLIALVPLSMAKLRTGEYPGSELEMQLFGTRIRH